MRSVLLYAALLVGACGCNPQSAANPSASTGVGDQTGSAKPDAAIQTPTAPQLPNENSVTQQSTDHAKKLSTPPAIANPNRIYQLKDLKTVDLKVQGHVAHAWIMDTESKRQEGMMFLTEKEVQPDQGMIFVFPSLQLVSSGNAFWMHNTLIPLDIIYISSGKKVINVGNGRAMNDSSVKPGGDYLYVLEMKRGWAARNGVKPGDIVQIPPGVKTSE